MSRPSSARTCSGTGTNREAGAASSRAWCGRSWLYSDRNASTAACAAATSGNGPCAVKQSRLQGLVEPLHLARRGR